MKLYNGSITFPHNLKAARVKAGYTQSALAEKLGMTRQNYSRYESSDLNAQPSLELLCELSHILNTTPNDLIGYPAIADFKEDELKYAHRMLKDYNNFVVGNDTILYGYLTEHQLMGLERSRKFAHVIEIPKEIFIQLIKKSRLYAEENINLNIERWFKEDFNNALNRNCYEYFNSTKK